MTNLNEQIVKYYQDRVKKSGCRDFLWQVGKTVNGKEVSADQVKLIISGIKQKLQLTAEDVVLDIGCGNGLLTKEIAEDVLTVTGIELTAELYQIAVKYNNKDNIVYRNEDFLECAKKYQGMSFNKVYLYEVIQHLDYKSALTLFSTLDQITTNGASIFVGGILDEGKREVFFNTPERKLMLFDSLVAGKDPLGTWYHKEYFEYLAERLDMQALCFDQNINLYTSHYRFDCLLQKHG